MLQKITDTIDTHKWLWYSILGALALVFAAWGAYGLVNLNVSTSSYAAEAGGQTISLDEAHNVWIRTQAQLQQQFGGNIPPAVQKTYQDQVLEGLISDALMSERTREARLPGEPARAHRGRSQRGRLPGRRAVLARSRAGSPARRTASRTTNTMTRSAAICGACSCWMASSPRIS